MKVTHGEMTSSITVPRCASAALSSDSSCFLSPENERADEGRAELDGQRAGVDRRQVVDDAGLQLGAEVRGRRELTLGQAVAAVVLDDVDDRQVAAHQVHELADADRAGVAVAADADRDQLVVGEHRAGADRRHAAVHGVEAVRAAEEIRRALARAADARQLDDLLGIDAHLVEGVDDALGDRVMAAAGAQRRLAALVDRRFETDAVHFDWCRHWLFPTRRARAERGRPSFSPLRSLPAPAHRR